MTFHNTESSAGFDIALKREGKKFRKREKEAITTQGIRILVTHPSANPAEQGLTLLSGCNIVLSLLYTRKGNRGKKSLILAGKIKNKEK